MIWLVFFLCLFPSLALAAVSIPLTVHELLPLSETGIARTNELVSFGVPLKDADGITSTDQLAIQGATAWQIKATSRYPSGNLQWVLVSFLATVPAGGSASYTLATGSSTQMTLTGIAFETTSLLSINTGVAQFTLRKQGFNLLDGVTVGGVPLVVPGHAGGFELTTSDGVLWSSRFDNPIVTLTENGPAKAVVTVNGRFKNAQGVDGPMGYTVVLTFAKDSAAVGLRAILRNAYAATYKQVEFDSAELGLPTALTGILNYTLPVSTGNQSGTLAFVESVYGLQGYSLRGTIRYPDIWALYSNSFSDWYDPGGFYLSIPIDKPTMTGAKVEQTGTILKAFSQDIRNDYLFGWGELAESAGKGVTAAYKNLPAYYPGSIEFESSGLVTVGLFSKRNPIKKLVFDWSTYESRDVRLDFHTQPVNNALVQAQLQTPLFGRAPFEQYRDAGAFFGETHLATYTEQRVLYAANGRANFTIPNVYRDVTRTKSSGAGGTVNQRDYPLGWMLDYVRVGHGGQMLNALQYATYLAEQFTRWSDGFDAGTSSNIYMSGYPHLRDSKGNHRVINGGYANHFEDDYEHIWVYNLLMAHWLTGDLYYYDAFRELAESVYSRCGTVDANKIIFSRLGISCARMMVLSWAYLGHQQRYLDTLNRLMVYFLDTETQYPNAPTIGRNRTRGYIAAPLSGSGYPTIPQEAHVLFLSTYFPPVINDLLKLLPAGYVFQSSAYPGKAYTLEDLADMLEGMARFVIQEAFTYPVTGRPTVATWYNTAPGSNNINVQQGGPYDGLVSPALAFVRSGTAELLTLGMKHAVTVDQAQAFVSQSEIGLLRFLWETQHQADVHVQDIPLTVQQQGTTYIVSWTTPPGTTAVQLKYADKPMVPNLGYDKLTAQYRYDPATYAPFWGASNVATEPAPVPGQMQQMTLSGLSCADHCQFALRATGKKTGQQLNAPTGLRGTIQ